MADEEEKAPERGGPGGPGDWREVALLFLRLGTIAFGGPAAHTALMRDELVRRYGFYAQGYEPPRDRKRGVLPV